jgi:hypothetical protein
MTDKPLHSAAWHARLAEDLTSLVSSASMAGWLRRGRRRGGHVWERGYAWTGGLPRMESTP